MGTTQTTLFAPPTRAAAVDAKGFLGISFRQWLFTLQMLFPLRLVDTTAGPYAEDVPPAGLNNSTGQSNQNQEITYKKTSADGNTFTLNGSVANPLPEGPLTLTTQYEFFKIKSDGTSWWKTG